MEPRTDKLRGKKIAATSFVLLSFSGILVSYWHGLGWLMLSQTIRELLFAIPRFYLRLVYMISDREFAEKETIRLQGKSLFASPSLARRAIFSIAMTILVFWKVNIPIHRIVELIVH